MPSESYNHLKNLELLLRNNFPQVLIEIMLILIFSIIDDYPLMAENANKKQNYLLKF